MPEIPNEILSRILGSDLRMVDQLQCSLVCNQWLLTSRQTKHFEQACLNVDNLDSFASLVVNPLSTFRSCIRHLILDFDPIRLRRSLPVLQLLTNITNVETRNLDWTNTGVTDYVHEKFIATICPTVKSLTFGKGTKFNAFTEALGIACRMQELEELHFDAVCWSTVYLSAETPSFTPLLPTANHVFLDLPPHITLPGGCCRMSARSCQTRDIVQWLLSHRPFPILRHLSLEIFPENTTYMCIFLEAASETLEWLEISYDFSHWPGEQVTIECFSPISQHPIEAGMGWHKPSFTYGPSHTSIEKSPGQPNRSMVFNRLHTVRFNNFIYYTDLSRSSAATFGMSALQLMSICPRPASFERIIFVIVLDRVADLGLYTFNWSLLDRLLIVLIGQNNDVYPLGGRRVVFEIGGAVDLESLSFEVRSKLQLCESQGCIDMQPLV